MIADIVQVLCSHYDLGARDVKLVRSNQRNILLPQTFFGGRTDHPTEHILFGKSFIFVFIDENDSHWSALQFHRIRRFQRLKAPISIEFLPARLWLLDAQVLRAYD